MGEIRIGRMAVGMYQTNCYFVYREGENKAIVFDPGDHGDKIYEALKRSGLSVCAIMITHGHFDHIWGVDDLKKKADEERKEIGLEPIKVYANEAERKLLVDIESNVSMQMRRPCKLIADVYLEDLDEIEIEGMKVQMISTPGHTIGGCCYYFKEADILVCGDTLFLESVGRTDFPTGSMSELVRSVKEKLFVLPKETKVFPGHGDSTTIDHEMKYNPFCCE